VATNIWGKRLDSPTIPCLFGRIMGLVKAGLANLQDHPSIISGIPRLG
jgi:hypothetical protein